MSKILKITLIVGALFLAFTSDKVFAQQPSESTVSDANITYPITALGSCKDKTDCKNYCSVSAHMLGCVNFAETQGMLKGEDLRVSKIVAEKVFKNETPGQCKSKEECEKFCSEKVENIKECVSFGEELGVITPAELAQAKSIMVALEKGAKMPGECKDKAGCEKYCAVGAHIDECLSFAESANILSPEDLKQAKAVAPYLKTGETPGKCQSKNDCENYCKDENNFAECVGFAEKVGFISQADAEMARKTGGIGPGGCKDMASCDAYCNEQSHAEECFNYALGKGLVDDRTADLMKTGVDQMNSALESLPDEIRTEVVNCLESKIGVDTWPKILSKKIVPTKNQGDIIQGCFAGIEAKVNAMMKSGGGGGAGGGSMRAPTPEEIQGMIPDNVPDDVRVNIEKQVQEYGASGGNGMPVGSPTKFVPTGVPTGVVPVPSGGQMPKIDCSMFSSMPDVSYCKMAGQAEDACRKCKGQ